MKALGLSNAAFELRAVKTEPIKAPSGRKRKVDTEESKLRKSPRIAQMIADGVYDGVYVVSITNHGTTPKSNSKTASTSTKAARTGPSTSHVSPNTSRTIAYATAEKKMICARYPDNTYHDFTTGVTYQSNPSTLNLTGQSGAKHNAKSNEKGKDLVAAKVFGHQPKVRVGTCLLHRQDFHDNLVHRNCVAGIFGDADKGAYSVVLSGRYEDNHDEGAKFTFTGEGGRKGVTSNGKKANLCTAAQCTPQAMVRGNLALKISCQNGNPVRVVRGFKGKSKFAPLTGYRYDGVSCHPWYLIMFLY